VRRNRRRALAIAAGAGVVIGIAALVAYLVVGRTSPVPHTTSYLSQVVLPFSGLRYPSGVVLGASQEPDHAVSIDIPVGNECGLTWWVESA
jgi:hypothetical protein